MCGGKLGAWCQELTPCPQLAVATHIGRPGARFLTESERRFEVTGPLGVPVTPGGALTGPAGGLGWAIEFLEGAPAELNVSNIQLPHLLHFAAARR